MNSEGDIKPWLYVTKPFLPDASVFQAYAARIWETGVLTNNGPLLQELEAALKVKTGSDLLFTSNGTIAIQIAIKALNLKGDIITTPFSYVATTSTIIWENCNPVFADIDANDWNIDPEKIEACITSETCAILATHVFGIPCQDERIQAIADKHHLKVIYDAAHAFGVTSGGKSVFQLGDIATCSFHATKVFHTAEGGAIFTNDEKLKKDMYLLRSFGHIGDEYFVAGINGKNSEFHAAMGLAVLSEVDEIIAARKRASELYDVLLKDCRIRVQKRQDDITYNYAYYPVLFQTEDVLLEIMAEMKKMGIIPRRYFYPSLNRLPYIVNQKSCPVSESVAARILCLPLSHNISESDQKQVADILRKHC